jgi:hypothetical protein
MKNLLFFIIAIIFINGCGDKVTVLDPYSPPEDVYGVFTSDMKYDSKYYIPIDEIIYNDITSIRVRWVIGSITYPDGTIEPAFTYWQDSCNNL